MLRSDTTDDMQRKVRGRVRLTNGDRLFFIQLYRWFPSVLKAITIVRPETLVRWHRAGFRRRYWRWKSRSLGGRPQIDADLRALIRRMSVDNPLWGAPRIHGELLKLGFDVAPVDGSDLHGGLPFAIMRTELRRLISLWFRRSPFSNYSHLFSAINGGSYCGCSHPKSDGRVQANQLARRS